MLISYDYYRIFYYVAKYRSFTQAANILLSNQPNISRAVKNLENALGFTLFVRSNRSVRLTPEGEQLYAHIQIAFEQIQAGEEALALERSLQSGSVSIGASETALHCLLLPVLRSFRRTYPGIRLRVTNHLTTQAIAALKSGLVDLSVVTTPLEPARSLVAVPIKPFREVAVCGPAFSALAERPRALHELAGCPFVSLGAQTKTFEFYAGFFSQHGLALAPDVEAATADQILPMVENDLGIGFVPEDFLPGDAAQRGIRVIELLEPVPPRSVCLVKRRDQTLSLAAKALEQMIRAAGEPAV